MLRLEQIMHSKKLAYEPLTELMKPYIRDNDSDTINIFIDVWDILKSLYKPEVLESLNTLKARDRFLISSEMINIIGHYRHFFYSRARKYTNFILFDSHTDDKDFVNLYPDYKKELYEKRFDNGNGVFANLNKIIEENMSIVKIFCEYIPHTYFINSSKIEPSTIPYLFMSGKIRQTFMNFDRDLSIIISNSSNYFQDLTVIDKVIQLDLRGKEKSRIISSADVIDVLKSKSKAKEPVDYNIMPDLMTVIQAFTGNKTFNVKSINRYGNVKALNTIQKLLNENAISNVRYDTNEWMEKLVELKVIKEEHLVDLERNFILLNHASRVLTQSELAFLESQLVDKIDAKSVRFVNERYFTHHPILIDYVFEGEEYE